MSDRNTQQHNTSAAIYCRISRDKSGLSAGVDRQETDCRAMAERLGLTVDHVLVDNDISAYSGKPRPAYAQLLKLMKEGSIGTVLAFHQDRLQRSPRELETYVDASEIGHVTTHTVLAGHIDLSTPSGRFNARIIGAAARYEVEHMIERQRAAKLQAAKDGKYLGGQRPFGFEPQRTSVREDEAAILREMAQRVTEGSSFLSVATDLNRRGIETQHGKEWNALKVRNVLIRPINAGIVLHRGVEHQAETPAIFSKDEWRRLNESIVLNRQRSKHSGRFRVHLLNGFIVCGACGQRLMHKSKQQRDGTYKTSASCSRRDKYGEQVGCGKVSRMVEPIIDLVSDALIYRLTSPELASAVQEQRSESQAVQDLLAQQRTLEARLIELTDDYYVNRLLSRDEFERIKAATDLDIERVAEAIHKLSPARTVVGIDLGQDLREAWENGSIEWRRELMTLLIQSIYVHPRPKSSRYTNPKYKAWRFDPELIEIRWRA